MRVRTMGQLTWYPNIREIGFVKRSLIRPADSVGIVICTEMVSTGSGAGFYFVAEWGAPQRTGDARLHKASVNLDELA